MTTYTIQTRQNATVQTDDAAVAQSASERGARVTAETRSNL